MAGVDYGRPVPGPWDLTVLPPQVSWDEPQPPASLEDMRKALEAAGDYTVPLDVTLSGGDPAVAEALAGELVGQTPAGGGVVPGTVRSVTVNCESAS